MTLRLGKLHARRDPRTLRFAALLDRKRLPSVPSSFDYDAAHPPMPVPMFGNDAHGCCVISARAHATLRFERTEQDLVVPISTDEVLAEWYAENGGTEDGLEMLASLKQWRSRGWMAAGELYTCAAFAAVDPCITEHVQAAIFLFGSVEAGFSLPYSVTRNMDSIETWDIVAGPECAADPSGGHAVAICGYDADGLTGLTWGRRQRLSYAFLEAYCDELWAIVDALDPWRQGQGGIDVPALEAYLRELAS